MKRVVLILVAALLITAGCHKDKDDNGMMMTMTVMSEMLGLKTVYMAGSGTFTIDWGDGSEIETHELLGYDADFLDDLSNEKNKFVFRHYYSGIFPKTITIIGKNITHIDCGAIHNQSLTNLDVSKNTELMMLQCSGSQLTSLDVSKNINLTSLYCSYNLLTSLDVGNNAKLTALSCDGNPLTNLDVSKNTALKVLVCDHSLTSLDVSNNIALEALFCSYNQLESLDVSNNTALTFLYCSNNQLSRTALNALFETLHANDAEMKKIYINFNPGSNDCDRSIAEAKGWVFW